MSTMGAFRPPQWVRPAMVAITQVPVQGQSNGVGDTSGSVNVSAVPGGYLLSGSGSTSTTYVFDAVLDLDHDQRLEKTRHPVQTGTDISSHAYLQPARLTLSIGMSDVLDAYSNGVNTNPVAGGAVPSTVASFTGSPSKSVSAYQTMLALQSARQPLTITTRLRTYTNMLLVSVAPREEHKTITGLRMRLEFEQVLTGYATTSTVTAPPLTARPDATQSTGLGTVNPSSVPAPTQSQFQFPQTVSPNTSPSAAYGLAPLSMTSYIDVPGAGSYSSIPGQQQGAP